MIDVNAIAVRQANNTVFVISIGVNPFRSTIAGGTSIRQSVYVLIGLIAVFTLLTILQFNHMAHQRKANKETLYDWLEEKGLA